MDDLIKALIVCIGLFLGTFVCAYLPSTLDVSKKNMNLVSIFGSGTIIGACIFVILPESCGLLINASYQIAKLQNPESEPQVTPPDVIATIGATIMAGFTLMLVMDEGFKIIGEWRAEAMQKELIAQACRKKDEDANIAMEQEDENSDTNPNETEGDSLVNGVKRDNPTIVVDEASYQLESGLITTIAIGLHSLIEGVAMAASMYLSTTGQNMQVGLVVTFALFLHKAPEAAGLGTFLAHCESTNTTRLTYILAYSFCSPLTAFIGFLCFNAQKESALDNNLQLEKLNYWNGFVMLVSVGTLLYITMLHMLPEVYPLQEESSQPSIEAPAEQNSDLQRGNQDKNTNSTEPQRYPRIFLLTTLLAGMYSAGLMTLIGGGHDHELHGGDHSGAAASGHDQMDHSSMDHSSMDHEQMDHSMHAD